MLTTVFNSLDDELYFKRSDPLDQMHVLRALKRKLEEGKRRPFECWDDWRERTSPFSAPRYPSLSF